MDPDLLMAPIIVFVSVVLPIWVVFHYITIWRREKLARKQDSASTHKMEELADRLEQRLDAIESILDADSPGWRNHHDR